MHINDDRKIEGRKMKVPDFHFNFGRRGGILLKMHTCSRCSIAAT